MFANFIDLIYKHFRNNILLYFCIIIFLIIGISAGAITTKVLNNEQKNELINFMDSFFRILNENDVDSSYLLKYSLINNLQTILILWLLGITIIGAPLIIGVVLLRGFVIGFTVGFLFLELGFKGFLFSVLAILPQNIFVIPGILIVSVISARFSIMIMKNKIRKNMRYNYLKELTSFTLFTLITSILVILGSFVEAYITPVFMRLILGYVS